jgi:hypothetical protein
VPFFPLNTEAHDVASVEVELRAVVPPDIYLFVLVTAQGVRGREHGLLNGTGVKAAGEGDQGQIR